MSYLKMLQICLIKRLRRFKRMLETNSCSLKKNTMNFAKLGVDRSYEAIQNKIHRIAASVPNSLLVQPARSLIDDLAVRINGEIY